MSEPLKYCVCLKMCLVIFSFLLCLAFIIVYCRLPFAVYFRELRIRACSALLICSFWYFLSSFLCFSYYEIVCRLLLARKIGCRSQVNSFLLTTSREKAKKTWGKRGRTGGGGNNCTVLQYSATPY